MITILRAGQTQLAQRFLCRRRRNGRDDIIAPADDFSCSTMHDYFRARLKFRNCAPLAARLFVTARLTTCIFLGRCMNSKDAKHNSSRYVKKSAFGIYPMLPFSITEEKLRVREVAKLILCEFLHVSWTIWCIILERIPSRKTHVDLHAIIVRFWFSCV